MDIAVIGGGVFGVMTATRLAEMGQAVTLFERLPGLLQGTSVSANRLHSGFHYPRDFETARQCLRGSRQFRADFAEAIVGGVGNAYFIARDGSLTSPADYLAHCDRLGVRYRVTDPQSFQPVVKNVALGVLTDEAVYDPVVLRGSMTARLQRSGARVRVDREVLDIRRDGARGIALTLRADGAARFDAVVNCAYAEINRLTARLGHPIETRQYEYVAVPVVDLDWPGLTSISVLDGPFISLLPFGAGGRYLLYHVRHSVVAETHAPMIDRAWLDPRSSPFAAVDVGRWFGQILASACSFVPDLATVRFRGVVQGPRMVLAGRDDTDARPSVVTSHARDYVTVFSGKVDHCTWVADEVARELGIAGA